MTEASKTTHNARSLELGGKHLPLRILHVIPSLDPADGGPAVAVPLLARAIAQRGHRVVILTTQKSAVGGQRSEDGDQRSEIRGQTSEDGSQKSEVRSQKSVVRDGVEYIYARRNTNIYKISRELVGWLKENVANFDLVHIHALFSFSSTAAAFIAERKKVPYIIRPLGVLNQWGIKNRRAFLKRASLALIEKGILTRAVAIHYTAEAERTEASKLGPWITDVPSFVIPLPVQVEKSEIGSQRSEVGGRKSEVRDQRWEVTERFLAKHPEMRGKRIVLFLSRIDRKKGIELLLSAFADVRKKIENIILVIAGSGDRAYEESLRDKAQQLKVSEAVLWTGFVTGDDKVALFDAAEIFVLPSYSENFGIAAAEAMAAGKACILSDQVGIALEASRESAAIVTRCDEHELVDAFQNILADPGRRDALGRAAQDFAKRSLSIDAIGEQLELQYRAIAKRELSVNG